MRLERQLHDGASLRISALTLRLGLLRAHSADDAFQRAVGELQDELHAVLDELRRVAGEIYPPLLDQAGLGPALRELADSAGLPVIVRASAERFGTAAEGAAYFAVADCLAAWTRTPGGPDGPVEIVVDREDQHLVLSLTGVPTCHAEQVTDHAVTMGGVVEAVESDGPGGDLITVRIPCE